MSKLSLELADMVTLEGFHEYCDEEELEVSIFTGFDKAIMGLAIQGTKRVAVYSFDLLIEELMRQNEWEEEEALEWYGFNMTGYHDGCPVVLYMGVHHDPA